jgi:hypothetical protein
VLLDGVTSSRRRIAEGVRQAIRDFRFVWGASTLSVGAASIVQIRAETENMASVMSATASPATQPKDAGRNRIHVYGAEGSRTGSRMHWVSRVTRHRGQPPSCISSRSCRSPAPGNAPSRLTVRLRDDSGELVAPTEFIPAAERLQRHVGDRPLGRGAGAGAAARAPATLSCMLPLLAVNLSGTSSTSSPSSTSCCRASGTRARAALCFEIRGPR